MIPDTKHTAQRLLGYLLLRTTVLLFFGMWIFVRCANTMAPQGGPRDTLPPKVVAMTPAYGTTNFKGRRIYIEFDEYVQLKDQQKEFFTAPFMKKKPSLTLRGRGIQIDLQDTLKENTTYALNFCSSIQDNNEGNPLHSFRYVFSTGDQIDSLVMSGYTADGYTADSVAKTFLFFYAAEKDSIPEYDSTIFKSNPDFIARAENYGTFIAENLKPIDYRIYAVDDRNNNQMYEPGVDRIGFLDSTYNPLDMPPFSIWYDTMRQYLVPEPQLYFRLFTDDQFKRQYLAGNTRPRQHLAVINFGAKHPQIERLSFEGIDSSRIIWEYLKPTHDSIALWFDLPGEELPDTLKGEITYLKHDSLSHLVPTTQKLRLGWKAFESKQQEKERLKREKAREEALQEGREPEKEPNPFKYKVDVGAEVNPEKHIAIEFDYPLTQVDSNRISLIRVGEEDKLYRVKTTFTRDTANLRRWTLSAPWSNGQKYRLELPAGIFRNVAGESNDTLRAEFTVMNPENYATLVLNVTGKTPDSEYILELLDQSGTVLNTITHARSGEHRFNFVKPGSVSIRVIEDLNGNGTWDKGNLVERRQPERVEMFIQESGEEEIVTKVNWEMGFNIDMNKLFAPITMQRITDQLREAEEARIRKMLKEQEKIKAPVQTRPDNRHGTTSSGSSPFGGGIGNVMNNFGM